MVPIQYGIFDTKDGLWLGDEDGPVLFEDSQLARVASMVADMRLYNPLGRHQATVWIPAEMHLRDRIAVRTTALAAIRRLEGGWL